MDKQLELVRIKKAIGKVPPHELGKMFRDYYKTYLKVGDSEDFKESLPIFDGLVTVSKLTLDDTSIQA